MHMVRSDGSSPRPAFPAFASDRPHGLKGRSLRKYSGGTVRDSDPILYSLLLMRSTQSIDFKQYDYSIVFDKINYFVYEVSRCFL